MHCQSFVKRRLKGFFKTGVEMSLNWYKLYINVTIVLVRLGAIWPKNAVPSKAPRGARKPISTVQWGLNQVYQRHFKTSNTDSNKIIHSGSQQQRQVLPWDPSLQILCPDCSKQTLLWQPRFRVSFILSSRSPLPVVNHIPETMVVV